MTTLLLARIAGAFAIAFAPEGPPDDVERGLERCRTLLKAEKWAEAKVAVIALAREERDAEILLARRNEIVEILKRAAFRAGYRPPGPRALSSGDVLAFNASSGNVKIRYGKGELGDFLSGVERPPNGGGERVLVWRHPMTFRGEYSVQVTPRTPNWPGALAFLVAMEGDRAYSVALKEGGASRYEAVIVRFDGGKNETIDTAKVPIPASAVPIKVTVSYAGIACTVGSRKVLSSKKPAGLYGGFGIVTNDDVFEEILVEGKSDPAWLKGLVDAAETRAFAEFEKSFDPWAELPARLAAKAPEAETADRDDFALPDALSASQRKSIEPLLAPLREGRHDEALVALERLGKEEVPPATRDMLAAMIDAGSGRASEALVLAERVVGAAPGYVFGLTLRAKLLEDLDRGEEALEACEAIIAAFPSRPEGYARLAALHLGSGRYADAKAATRRALAAGVRSRDIDDVNELLVKAENGPPWTAPTEYKSKHYHVVTDMDWKTAFEASKVLEEAFFSYTYRLKRPADAETERFRVFLFSSRAGYESYSKGIGSALENTAGIYSPALRQLLIWNLPDREEFRQTIRHEGFHQYFDRIAGRPPIWLDEGLAEYYEIASVEDGKWAEGQPHPLNVRILTSGAFEAVPIASFVRIARSDFYARGAASYAQAWALVHFLRNGGAGPKRIFDSLFEKLAAGDPNRAALDAAFESVDFASLERDFAAHLRGLSR